MTAPGSWLLDALRPKPYVAPLLPVEDVAREGHAYARAAVSGALGELASAAPGTRNETAFRVACRLVELCRAGWSGLNYEQIRGAYMQTCAALNVDGTFRDGEHWSVWFKAERKASEPATLPPAAHLGSLINFSELPPGAADFGVAAQAAAAGVTNGAHGGLTGSVSGVAGTDSPPDPFEVAVRREHWVLAVRDEAKRRLDRGKARARDWGAELLSMSRMGEIPPPEPIVDGWLFRDSLGRIVGPSGALKTFVGIDLACSVATGRAWHGHITKQGLVIYVVGEGAAGIRQRIAAWTELTGFEVSDTALLILPWAVQTGGPDWADFVKHLGELRPALVVLDTQARVTVGRDENSAQDMGEAVAGWEDLRAATGAHVLLVHHTGVSGGERGRGSGAVFGALTSELLVSRSGMNLTVSNTKQKDVQTANPMLLTAQPVSSSLVLVGAMDPDRDGLINPTVPRNITRERSMLLVHVMREWTGTNGGTRAEIKAMYFARDGLRQMAPTAQRQAFTRSWIELERAGRIARNPLQERFLFVEIDGTDDLDPNPNDTTDFGWPVARRE